MVAGCRLRGQDEKRSAQHQAARRGKLGVEAVLQDCRRSGEARGLDALVEAGGHVDEERDREAERSEGEDDAAEARAAGVSRRDDGEQGGEQRHG
jgi:hypothetical protein